MFGAKQLVSDGRKWHGTQAPHDDQLPFRSLRAANTASNASLVVRVKFSPVFHEREDNLLSDETAF